MLKWFRFVALVATLVGCGAAAPAAHAQGCGTSNPNCIVPTAPAGTSNNQAASTAFVQLDLMGITGDCTVSSLYIIICTKTNGVPFGTMAVQNASNVAITGGAITGMPSPSAGSDVATKSYVDASVSSGITPLPQFATLATAAVLPNSPTYSNGALGVGATLTAGSNTTLTVDGTAAPLNTIVLVNNQAAPAQNGIYSVTQAGSGSVPWILTRVTFFDQAAEMLKGSYIFVTGGATQYNSAWTLNATVTTVGTTSVVWNPFSQILSIAASALTYTAPGTGGTARTQATRNAEWPSVTDYGAKCDGVTDDTTAIQNAMNATPTGGTLLFPTGLCVVVGSGSAALTRTTEINLVGTGMRQSGMQTSAAVPTTRDLLHIFPAAGSLTRGYSFTNMTLAVGAGGGGRSAVNIDSTANTSTNIAEIVFDRVYLQGNGVTADAALHLLSSLSNANGGIFNFTMKNSVVTNNGVDLFFVGDSLRFHDNIFTGFGPAVAGAQISGAGDFIFDGNNVTSAGGTTLTCAVAPRIMNNEFEQTQVSTQGNGSIVDINGAGCTIDQATLTNNQFQANGGIGTPTLVRFGANVSNPNLNSNRLGTPTSYSPIVNASPSLFCGNNVFSTGTPHVSGTAPTVTWGNGC